jgi:MerR family transcriptional regulator, light-induced transcriptional regulator
MYTIKEAAARSGVGAPLIRAWERRYGVVAPARTPSGYRLYDAATINVLVTMRSLIESGWPASEAARAITAGEVDLRDESAEASGARAPAPSAGAANRANLIARFLAAAEATSPDETEATLDAIFATGSFEAVVDDLLMPAAAALGEAWATGRMSVAAEHAASAAIARRLAAGYQAAGVAARLSVVVGLPPGARHELGALAFAVALRRRGVGVLYVGADCSIEGWLDVVARTGPRAAVIGVVTPDDRAAATTLLEALRTAGVPLVAAGGAAATAELAPGSSLVILPGRVVDAAGVVAEAVRRRR